MHVIITGASRGIGKALADRYEARGARVTGTARQGGDGLIALDVARPDGFATLRQAAGDAPVDLLICNAGIYPDKGETLDTGYPAALWAEAMAVNVTGVFLTIQTLLPNLRAAGGGRIAIISSQMGSSTRAAGGSYIYRATKAAVLNLGRNLARDLAPDGIAVGIYHPGWVRTDMGGAAAELTADEAAAGLERRFDTLDMAATGCFQTWDGRDHPF